MSLPQGNVRVSQVYAKNIRGAMGVHTCNAVTRLEGRSVGGFPAYAFKQLQQRRELASAG